jgi:hypothetical protein
VEIPQTGCLVTVREIEDQVAPLSFSTGLADANFVDGANYVVESRTSKVFIGILIFCTNSDCVVDFGFKLARESIVVWGNPKDFANTETVGGEFPVRHDLVLWAIVIGRGGNRSWSCLGEDGQEAKSKGLVPHDDGFPQWRVKGGDSDVEEEMERR